VGKASATGQLTGSFTASSFTLSGNVKITIGGITLRGTMAADNYGMAACGPSRGHQAGFEYDWSTGDSKFLGTSGCKENGSLRVGGEWREGSRAGPFRMIGAEFLFVF